MIRLRMDQWIGNLNQAGQSNFLKDQLPLLLEQTFTNVETFLQQTAMDHLTHLSSSMT